jgi:hypothetical protein
VSEPPKKSARRQRKPTLRSLLEAAKKAGKAVKSAVVEDGKVTLTFGEEPPDNNEWDERLSRGKH